MIIVNQNRNNIINFDNIESIEICADKIVCYRTNLKPSDYGGSYSITLGVYPDNKIQHVFNNLMHGLAYGGVYKMPVEDSDVDIYH